MFRINCECRNSVEQLKIANVALESEMLAIETEMIEMKRKMHLIETTLEKYRKGNLFNWIYDIFLNRLKLKHNAEEC